MLPEPSRNEIAAWRRLRALRRGETGAAVVEFALVVPVLFLVVFAIIDFGRALWIQNVLVSAVREGARYGASKQTTTQAIDSARYQTACYIGRVLNGAADCAAAIVAYPVANVNATINTIVGSASYGLITVQLTSGYSYTPITPYAARLGLASLTFRPVANFRWEQAS